MESYNTQNLISIQVICSGCRDVRTVGKMTREEIESNYVKWDFSIVVFNIEKAVDVFRNLRTRLERISDGTHDEMSTLLHNNSVVMSTENQKRFNKLRCDFRVYLSCSSSSFQHVDCYVPEEVFVREFHDELRLYENCHITDDMHWPLFVKTGSIPRIDGYTNVNRIQPIQDNNKVIDTHGYDKGCDGCIYKTRFKILATLTLLIIIVIAFYFALS